MYSTSVLLRYSVRRGWSRQDRLRQINVIVFDLFTSLVLVGVVKLSLLNLISFCCPGAMDNGGLLGDSNMEYDCGVQYSPLVIMLVLLLMRSSYISAMSIALTIDLGFSSLTLALVSGLCSPPKKYSTN